MSSLDRIFRQAVRNTIHNEGRQAMLGNAAGSIYFVDQDGITHGDEVYIRYVEADGTLTESHVKNSGLPTALDLPVLVVSRRGELTAVIDQFGGRIYRYTNGGGWLPQPQHAFSHYLTGTDPIRLDGMAIEEGNVKPSSPAALTVYVNPAWYMYQGVETVFEGGTSGSLSSYVPSSSANKHFVIICIDRSDNTITIVDGADFSSPYGGGLSLSDVSDIAIDPDYYPLAVVELSNGQTTVTAKDITFDRRRWLGSDERPPGDVSLLFSQTADKTIADTTDQTTLLSTGVGSLTLAADLLEAGTIVRLTATGHVSTTSTPTMDFEVTLGGTSLGSSGAVTLGDTISEVGWMLHLDIVCRTAGASGTVVIAGLVRLGAQNIGIVKTSTTTIDTTGTLALDFLGTWGTADASNTITCQTAVIENLAITGL